MPKGEEGMNRIKRVVIAVAVACGLAGAGATHAEVDDLWPTFAVGAGGYWIDTTDEVRIDGSLGAAGRQIDLQADLGLPDSKTLIQADLVWAFAERHSVELGYYSLERKGSRSLAREVEIGDTVFPVGATASASFETTAIEAAYTYWFVRHENFGFGGTIGLVELGLDAEASATVRLGGTGATISERADASTDLPVPMIGLAVKGSPVDRLVLYARGRFLPSVSVGDYSGEAGTYSAGAQYRLFGPVALGASYDGAFYKADVDTTSWGGSVDLVSRGWRLYLRANF